MTSIGTMASRPWRTVLTTAVLLVATRAGLRCLPFAHVRRVLGLASRPASTSPHESARDLLRAIAATARRVPGGGHCLTRALVAQTLLARAGHMSRVRIGLERRGAPASGLVAHAWVEWPDGAPAEEPDVYERYAAIAALEPVRP